MEESNPLVGAMFSGAGSVTLSGESEISVGVSRGLRS